ncbi:hypothetical protein D1872_90070 [compost metagenome]
MAGLEYRGNLSGVGITPALEMEADDAYFEVAKPNDPVKQNASGKIVRATATDTSITGVLAARDILRKGETPKHVKIRTDRQAFYEVKVAAGTPVVGTAYELNADAELDATATTNASVRVLKILPDGNVYVTLL